MIKLVIADRRVAKFLLSNPVIAPDKAVEVIRVHHRVDGVMVDGVNWRWPIVDGARRRF